MKKRELQALWRELFRRSAPIGLRRGYLVRILAYRLQEHAYGGLSADIQKRLRDLARKLAVDPEADLAGSRRFKPGTRLVRTWHGRSHEVTVLDQGYEYSGRRYSNLSEIARHITGARWSGPKFFGLKRPEKETRDAGRS